MHLPSALTYAEHPSDIIAEAAKLISEGRTFALITSLSIKGGAARDVGSLAMVDESGQMTGYLSNGCIDNDIQLRALDALTSKEKKVIRYGDGSHFFDLKLPCGGALDVLIDPNPDQEEILEAAKAFEARRPVLLKFERPADDFGPEQVFQFNYTPRFRLCLAGRGAIFRSVAQLGNAIGFDLCLLSPETGDLEAVGHLSNQPAVHLRSSDQAADLEILDKYSVFLTLFHDHDWEPGLLKAALQTEALFIGSLGSQRTHKMRQETLRRMNVAEDDLKRLHGPIGLVPSLREASFIAVSAIAEMVEALPPTIQSTD